MSAPNLPPLPEGLQCLAPLLQQWIHNHALAAYQAGRDAGLSEARQACMTANAPMISRRVIGVAAHYVACADAIDARKSDAKEGG